MKKYIWLILLIMNSCNLPENICETESKDNVCRSQDDCAVAFCAANCKLCPAVYSRKQISNTWCLTIVGEQPRSKCVEAGKAVCDQGGLPSTCPRYLQAECQDGKCVPVFEPP